MRRNVSWDKIETVEAEILYDRLGHPQMARMDRIKRAAVNANALFAHVHCEIRGAIFGLSASEKSRGSQR
jgi:hypothetical protein